MNSSDQKKITKNLIVLQRELKDDVNIIADKLYEQKVFTREVWQEISNMRCRPQKSNCGVFINHLLRSGKDSYAKFKNILIDLGHHKLVTAMERAGCNENTPNWTEDRGKTFVLQDLKLPERLRKQAWVEDQHHETVNDTTADEKIENVHQLERLTTFVSTEWDREDINNNKVVIQKDIRNILEDDPLGEEEFSTKLFKTSKLSKLPLTTESRAH